MCAMRKDLRTIRLARFEAFEPRVMLSADVAGLTAAQSDYGFDGSGQTVVVIDTGVAYDHLALGGGFGADYRVVGGFDFTEDDADPYDDGPVGSHGTHVAGIIASSDAANPGVAPGADIVALRVFDDRGYGQFAWVEEALAWVHENINSFANPITTVNLSLGAVYNSDSVPSWATLEDELAQLAADGVFIAVAAGNKFTSYNEAGLSYPAVSQYVVPVASLDDDGSLSFYSQRSGRVIAAPGRSITSTVPDYVGNDNGIDDDFATYSGTSMAAPYVAGAAVLIRQAFEFVGMENVTQAAIYELMCSTADTVYDPVTGASYFSLNVARALESIVGNPPDDPDDDPGDESPVDISEKAWGVISQATFENQRISSAGQWFSFTAAADGILTVEALFDHGDGDVDIELYDADHRLLAGSYGLGDVERIDVAAQAGEKFLLRAVNLDPGVNDAVDFRVTNLVARQDGTLFVSGTDGDDAFVFSPGSSYQISVNGVEYSFPAAAISNIMLDGQGGNDAARFFDSAGNDSFLATPTYSRLRGQGFYLRAVGFESVHVEASAGGYDSAYLYDSSGNDALLVSPGSVTLAGDGFSIEVDKFEYVSARASGGADTAAFQTSAVARFTSAAGYALLRGVNYTIRAAAFDHVHTLSAAAAAGQTSSAVDAESGGERSDHRFAGLSLAELYGFELARGRSQKTRYETGKDQETQALDLVLARFEDWT